MDNFTCQSVNCDLALGEDEDAFVMLRGKYNSIQSNNCAFVPLYLTIHCDEHTKFEAGGF
jgi:hypothetical protein